MSSLKKLLWKADGGQPVFKVWTDLSAYHKSAEATKGGVFVDDRKGAVRWLRSWRKYDHTMSTVLHGEIWCANEGKTAFLAFADPAKMP